MTANSGTLANAQILFGVLPSGLLAPRSVTPEMLADNAISTRALANSSVTSAKIVNGTIVAADIANATITAAKLVATIPLGTLGYAQVTANQGPIAVTADLTSLAVTITGDGIRRVRFTAQGNVQSTVAGDGWEIRIQEGATVLQEIAAGFNGANQPVTFAGSLALIPSAGSHTYKLVLNRFTGSGDATLTATATGPAFLLAEDIGT